MEKKLGKKWFQRMIKVIVIGLVMVVVWYGQARLFKVSRAVEVVQLRESGRVPESGELTVACYNIAHARGPEIGADNWNSEERKTPIAHLRAIAVQIAESQASIVVLNEVDFNAEWSDGIDQAEIIAAEASFPFVIKQRNFDVTLPFFTLQFGNAILSKYPVSDARFLKFPARSQKEDIFAGNHDGLVATLQLSSGPLRVVAVHLEYRDEAARVGAANVLTALVSEDPGQPLIAMGDFNTAPSGFPGHSSDDTGDNAIALLQSEAGMKTIMPGEPLAVNDLTYPSTQPARIIDWILVSPGLTLMERRTIASELSDHRMVVGTISRRGDF
ncbi:MAG: endonuclease/exonuclease/phosphatase family protein [Verrucomicrobiae bacterium]|nr:endonuclease/exonuclease/phosphatase family protein [Verrucomicrobiae bacterium]